TVQPPDANALWASLTTVYPEMQDWVARRGHGGPSPWSPTHSPKDVAALAAATDLTIVQIHSGFQFQDAMSQNLRQFARQAIDGGADLVVCQHPHVIQGLEFYKGKLIAYSLGNFVFDQDFFSTFADGFLRTVWEGRTLVEARMVPFELSAYRPVPVTD